MHPYHGLFHVGEDVSEFKNDGHVIEVLLDLLIAMVFEYLEELRQSIDTLYVSVKAAEYFTDHDVNCLWPEERFHWDAVGTVEIENSSFIWWALQVHDRESLR